MGVMCQNGMTNGFKVLHVYPQRIHAKYVEMIAGIEEAAFSEADFVRWVVFHESAHLYQGQHGLMMDTARLPREVYQNHPGELLANAFADQWVAPLRPEPHWPILHVAAAYACPAPAGRLKRTRKSGASTCVLRTTWSTSCDRPLNRVRPRVMYIRLDTGPTPATGPTARGGIEPGIESENQHSIPKGE